MADGDYIKDIEVNDLRNRYTLTKGVNSKNGNFTLQTCGILAPLYSSCVNGDVLVF